MAKNKKRLKRFIIALLILTVAFGALCIWQKDNITAFIQSYTMTEDDMIKRTEEDVKKVSSYLEQNELKPVRDLTQDEQTALVNDEITDKQAVKIMRDEITLEEAKQQILQNADRNNQSDSAPENKTEEAKTEEVKPDTQIQQQQADEQEVDYDTQISDLVAQVYVLKARFTSSLRNLEATVNNAFYSLPKEQRNMASKTRIINEYTQSALDMQADCDNQVANLLKELEEVLKKAGRDTAIIDTIKTSYENEKSTTKSMYIRKYLQ